MAPPPPPTTHFTWLRARSIIEWTSDSDHGATCCWCNGRESAFLPPDALSHAMESLPTKWAPLFPQTALHFGDVWYASTAAHSLLDIAVPKSVPHSSYLVSWVCFHFSLIGPCQSGDKLVDQLQHTFFAYVCLLQWSST